jgi:DNA polymerase-1
MDNEFFDSRPHRDDLSYHVIQTEKDLRDLIAELQTKKAFSIHLKTTGSDPLKDRIVGIAISTTPCTGHYIPTGEEQIPTVFQSVLEDQQTTLYLHDAKLNLQFLLTAGIDATRAVIVDTMIAAILLNHEKSELKWLTEKIFGEKQIKSDEVSKKGQTTLDIVSAQNVGFNACTDADFTFRLAHILRVMMESRDQIPLFEVEMEVLKVLTFMERKGVRIDVAYLKQLGPEFKARIEKLQSEIWKYTGKINLNSNKQMADKLFGEMKFPTIRPTKKGFSVDNGVLEELKKRTAHALFDLIQQYRSEEKLYSTYVKGLQRQVDKQSRTHTSFWQCVSTGRLSSSNPNLQNIPNQVRRAIVAEEGHVLLSFDYSQIELRVLAYLSKDEMLASSFLSGLDVHVHTASQIYNCSYEHVTDEMRKVAKTLNFGLVYGISAWSIAVGLGISEVEAARFMEMYFKRYSGVKKYIDVTKSFAKKNGYVETILKRRVMFPDINCPDRKRRGHAERAAINAPVQGSAADVIKIAMSRIRNHPLCRYLVLQVHDELLLEVPRDEVSNTILVIKPLMEISPLPDFTIPIVADVEYGPSYGQLTRAESMST